MNAYASVSLSLVLPLYPHPVRGKIIMVYRISDYHVPPFSPGADPEGLHLQGHKSGNVGEKLYEHSSAFYSWYQWVRKTSDSPQSSQNLQVIMQIAQKASLTPEEEQEAVNRLSDLREDLDSGRITMDQIGHETDRIIDELTENNPKSRVVMYTTQIEIAINLSEGEPSDELREALNQLMNHISPEMPNIQAETLSRNLSLILDSSSSRDVLDAFHKTILPLLNKG